MDRLLVFFFGALLLSCAFGDQQDCLVGLNTSYSGTRANTASGKTCQRWDVDKPHQPNIIPDDGGQHNFCRNPDGDIFGLWCYTTDKATIWEYCEVEKCLDDSKIVWALYNPSLDSSSFMMSEADPEIVKQKAISSTFFSTLNSVPGSVLSGSEFQALAADYSEQRLFFVDGRKNFLGVWYKDAGPKQLRIKKYYKRKARGIVSLAYDGKLRHLYLADANSKQIMITDEEFRYRAPVYTARPDLPLAVALHVTKRLLFFSTYKVQGSKIIVTDLAGMNPKILFQHPTITNVTSLTIDYTDDRLYWTDNNGEETSVDGSNLDGSKRRHYFSGSGTAMKLKGIAAYMDYIYIHARTYTYANWTSSWIIEKETRKVYHLFLNGKPGGVALFSKNVKFEPSSDDLLTCSACDQVCLPSTKISAKCVCSVGYTLDKSTKKCM